MKYILFEYILFFPIILSFIHKFFFESFLVHKVFVFIFLNAFHFILLLLLLFLDGSDSNSSPATFLIASRIIER